MPSTHMEKSVPWSRFMPRKKYWLAFPSPLCCVATIPGNISASSPILRIGRVLKSARVTKPSDEEDAVPTFLVALPYTIVSSRCACSSWGEYFSDDHPIDRGLRFFTALLLFIGLVSLILKRFAKKSESYTNSEEFIEDIGEK